MVRCYLLLLTLVCSGCSTFATHYDRVTLEPYAGVQNTGKGLVRIVTSNESFNLKTDTPPDNSLMTSFDEGISRLWIVGCWTIDLPFTFIADSVLLPFQAYWYLNPDVEQSKAQHESPVDQAEGR